MGRFATGKQSLPKPDGINQDITPTTTSFGEIMVPGPNDGIAIAYNNLTYSIKVPPHDSKQSCFGRILPCTRENDTFYRLRSLTGGIEPGKMVLILGPSGAGSTTFLKSITDRLETTTLDRTYQPFNKHKNGTNITNTLTTSQPHLLFNGLTPSQYNKSTYSGGGTAQEQFQYMSQLDKHFNHFTVEETLGFACRSAFPTPEQRQTMTGDEIELFISNRVNSIISLLDLHSCRGTIVGDHVVRGISGGQARRVSIGEVLITSPRILALDHYTDGLDIVVSLKITQALRGWCTENNTTVIATIQQPNEAILNLFDSVIVLREGCCVFNGPTSHLLPYFEDRLGYQCPSDVSICDFILDIVSDPYLTSTRLAQRQQILHDHGIITTLSFPNKPQINQVFGLNEMVDIYESSPYATEQRRLADYGFKLHQKLLWDEDLYKFKKSSTTKVSKSNPKKIAQTHILSPSSSINPTSSNLEHLLPTSLSTVSTIGSVESFNNDNNNYNQNTPLSTSQLSATPFPSTLGSSFLSVIKRQLTLAARSKAMISFRVINAIIASIILGTIFWDIPTDTAHIFQRVTVLCIMFSQFSVCNMGGVLTSCRYANVIKKQVSSGFFPSWYYTLSLYAAGMPQLLFDISVITTVLYFGSRFYPSFYYFSQFWFISLLTAINNYAIVQVSCSITTSEALAGAMSIPITSILMLGSGLFITQSHMPKVLSYFVMYTTPYFHATRTIANIEFSSPRYDEIGPDGERLGDIILKQLDITKLDNNLICIAYMLGTTLFWICVHAWVIRARYYHDQIGTERHPVILRPERLDIEIDISTKAPSSSPLPSTAQTLLPTLTQYLPFVPCTITFEDLSYHVQVPAQPLPQQYQSPATSPISSSSLSSSAKTPLLLDTDHIPSDSPVFHDNIPHTTPKNQTTTTSKQILDQVSGFAKPGQFCALCGPSGSGKTTLIEILSQRKTIGTVTGSIKANGHQLISEKSGLPNQINTNSIIGFVEQHDWIYANETVHDALNFVLDMKLPKIDSNVSNTHDQNEGSSDGSRTPLSRHEIKEMIITEILDVLELTPFAHHIIGMNSNGSKTSASSGTGLSLSLLKKLSIALELLNNPSVLYLDEPTTGLSATEAFSVLSLCQKIAKSGRTVIATVHSPSTEMFYLFDTVLLLGMGGAQIYNGPVGIAGRDFIQFYEKSGIVPKLSKNTNPASWMLECLQPDLVGTTAVTSTTTTTTTTDTNGDSSDNNDPGQTAMVRGSPQLQSNTDDDSLNNIIHGSGMGGMGSPISPTLDELDKQLAYYNHHIRKLNRYWKSSNECRVSTDNVQRLSRQVLPLTRNTKQGGQSYENYEKNNDLIVKNDNNNNLSPPTPPRNILYQFFRLAGRLFLGTFREPTLLITRTFMLTFVVTVAISVYGRLQITNVSSLITAIQSKSLIPTLSAILFSGQQLGMIDRRTCFLREVERGYYYNLWLFSFYFIELIFAVLFTVFVLSPAYIVLNYDTLLHLIYDPIRDLHNWSSIVTTTVWLWPWGQFVIGTITLLSFYTTFSLAIIAVSPDGRISGILQGLSALLFYYLNGILIPYSKLSQSPVASWVCRHNPTRYLTEAVVMAQFQWVDPTKAIEVVVVDDTIQSAVKNVLHPDGQLHKTVLVPIVDYVSDYLGYSYNNYWYNLAHVGVYSAVFLMIAIVANKAFWWKDR